MLFTQTAPRKGGVLEADLAIVDSVMVRAFDGGEATGTSPVDRRIAWHEADPLRGRKRRARRYPHGTSEWQ